MEMEGAVMVMGSSSSSAALSPYSNGNNGSNGSNSIIISNSGSISSTSASRKIAEQRRRRKLHLVRELARTELAYVQQLGAMIKRFVRPLLLREQMAEGGSSQARVMQKQKNRQQHQHQHQQQVASRVSQVASSGIKGLKPVASWTDGGSGHHHTRAIMDSSTAMFVSSVEQIHVLHSQLLHQLEAVAVRNGDTGTSPGTGTASRGRGESVSAAVAATAAAAAAAKDGFTGSSSSSSSSRGKEGNGRGVGGVLLSFAPLFKLYTVYAQHHQAAMHAFETEKFQRFIATLPDVDMHFLRGAMIQPLARIPQYQIFLRQTLGALPVHEEDKVGAQQRQQQHETRGALQMTMIRSTDVGYTYSTATEGVETAALHQALMEVGRVCDQMNRASQCQENEAKLQAVMHAYGGRQKLCLVGPGALPPGLGVAGAVPRRAQLRRQTAAAPCRGGGG
jgi:hypothetical protein